MNEDCICDTCDVEFCEHDCHLGFGDSEDDFAEFGVAVLYGWGF